MLSKDIKKFFTEHLDLNVRVHTLPCKARWVKVWLTHTRQPGSNYLVYTQTFPEDFRRICMKVVYPKCMENETSGGNITSVSIAMLPHEWTMSIKLYQQQSVANNQ